MEHESVLPISDLIPFYPHCTRYHQILSTQNAKLSSFSFAPTNPLIHDEPSARQGLPRWDAPSLIHLTSLPLTRLVLHRLSQAGARALSALFEKLGEDSTLEEAWLDFVWLDDSLCEKLSVAGRRLKRLRLGTLGTKLTDKGLLSILEGCDALEDLSLHEVEGKFRRGSTDITTLRPFYPVPRTILEVLVVED